MSPGLDWSSKSPPKAKRPPRQTKAETHDQAVQERHDQGKSFGVCKECAAPVRWAKTPNGVAIPLDREPSPIGNVILSGTLARKVPAAALPIEAQDAYTCHLDTCTRKRSQHQPAKTPTYRCVACVPNVVDKGGQREFYAHWGSTHSAG